MVYTTRGEQMKKISRKQITGMNFHYLHYPFEYFLDAMVHFEFQQIEVWGAAPHMYVEDLSIQDIRRIRGEIHQRELSVVCFTPEQCMYPINLAAKETEIRERSIRYFQKSIDSAVELEAPMVLVTAGWGYRNENSEEALKRSKASLGILSNYAEKEGIVLALEPLQKVESNIVNTLPDLKECLNEISSPFLKGMVDTIPMSVEGENLATYFDQLELAHIHFIDGKPTGHLAWGDGNLPLESYIQTLVQHDYKGALTLEFTSTEYLLNPNEAIEKSLETLAPYIN